MKDYAAYILDMDGVVWLHDEAIRSAVDAVNALKSQGKRVVFMTNNSTRLPAAYKDRLARMGVKDVEESDIVTSGTVTANYLKERLAEEPSGKNVFCVASDAVKTLLRKSGFNILGTGNDEHMKADYVVVGEPQLVERDGVRYLNFDELSAAVNAVKHGHARFIATNPDLTDPAPRGRSKPVAGAVIAYIQKCVDVEPLVLGKPKRRMYEDALKAAGCDASNALVIGDQLDTDIKGANEMGIDTALVETGAHKREDALGRGITPTYVLKDLSTLPKPAKLELEPPKDVQKKALRRGMTNRGG